MRKGHGIRVRTGRVRGRQWRKGTGIVTGLGTGKGKVLLNKPQGEKAHRAAKRLHGAKGMRHRGLTRAGIFSAACHDNCLR
jgi:hypothetical protein